MVCGERAGALSRLWRVQRGGEEERLQPRAAASERGHHLPQLEDGLEAARVEQPVGLVEHEEEHPVQSERASRRQVEQLARRAADHVHALLELPPLRRTVRAPHEEPGAERRLPEVADELLHALVHLLGHTQTPEAKCSETSYGAAGDASF
eukprot:2794356-Pleurochrysis_carterae.AAC.5